MPPEGSSPASSDDTTTTFTGEHSSTPSYPSLSMDSAHESDAASSSAVVSDVSSGSEPVVARTRARGRPERTWPAADEIMLLEVVASHRQKHGRLPSRHDLAAALRGRLRSEDRHGAEQVAKRMCTLRARYVNASRRLSRGVIMEKEDDIRIYKLSKLIWEGTLKGRKEKKARAADARQEPRGFGELAGVYPCLAAEVEAIEARCAPSAGLLKRAFRRIADDRAAQLEGKVKRQLVAEAKASAELDCLRMKVVSALLK